MPLSNVHLITAGKDLKVEKEKEVKQKRKVAV